MSKFTRPLFSMHVCEGIFVISADSSGKLMRNNVPAAKAERKNVIRWARKQGLRPMYAIRVKPKYTSARLAA